MTEKEYLLIREKPEIPMDIWYEYFLERGGTAIGLEAFRKAFYRVLEMGTAGVLSSTGVPKFVTFNSCLRSFYSYYNKKFTV